MEAVLASVIAVLGTLLGSGATHLFQRRSDERSAHFTRGERLRQERIDAYCAYAGAFLDYRRVIVHRWFVTHENRRDEDTPELRETVYKLRYAAQEAMFRAQMVSDDPALVELTEHVLESLADMERAGDREQLAELRAVSRQRLRDFVATVTPQVR
ncbi:hypothetical protein J1792_15650 [Streptomyces triculaminicus]|uniref:Uncharacterized protein n=2 Tax=Streptomyces TaxID=1883 RepID=A0A939FLD2_9ACTN|nr:MULTISPECIES: hypothetical protein [Streptomyces]MBO0654155.1 hypothetical protein [Streptomyces triculaminicus]QSY48832.1 hypothetical protein J3S04_28030 [Streptomyces griseocarneus]